MSGATQRIRAVAALTLALLLAGCSRSEGVDGEDTPPPAIRYEATKESLAQHPLPQWWQDGKFGIFIHWGPYSVPAYAPDLSLINFPYAEWYWFWQQVPGSPQWLHHLQTYGANTTYDDLIPLWRAENWDPQQWIAAFKDAGAKYFVLTAKHHDGFLLWPSEVSGRNAGVMGPKRDLVGELFEAARGSGLHPGLYYSMPEWFNTVPTAPNPALQFAVRFPPRNAYTQLPVPYTGQPEVDSYEDDVLRPQIYEMIRRYRPDLIWCDIGGDERAFRSNTWIADYFNEARQTNPGGVLVNDRCGDAYNVPDAQGTTHKDFNTVEYGTGDYTPPFEATQGMGHSFGYNAEEGEEELGSVPELLELLIGSVAAGGNLLLNIGPRADGTIPQPMLDRLAGMGQWLRINGEAIYASTAWTQAKDGKGTYFTVGKDGALYLIATRWPGQTLSVGATIPVTAQTQVRLLGSDGGPLAYRQNGRSFEVTLPAGGDQQAATASEHAFVFRVSPVAR